MHVLDLEQQFFDASRGDQSHLLVKTPKLTRFSALFTT